MFKSWSELHPKAKKELRPDFGFRNWNSLDSDEKYKIWRYLEKYFFDENMKTQYDNYGGKNDYYVFHAANPGEKERKQVRIISSIYGLNATYKARSYATNFLKNRTLNSACSDFYEIFTRQNENVVMELLSLYGKSLIHERANEAIDRKQNEKDQEYQKRLQNWKWEDFDEFCEDLDEVFAHFGINLYLTHQGFMPRQEDKIIREIYKPVLSYLSHPKWKEVSVLLSDSFSEYRKNTPQGYSICVTHTVCAIEAFLQVVVTGKTGKGNISKLIAKARSDNLIPSDFFTQKIFANMESIFARQRQETGIAHPKKEYASEKNARIMLNLAMICFQHCI